MSEGCHFQDLEDLPLDGTASRDGAFIGEDTPLKTSSRHCSCSGGQGTEAMVSFSACGSNGRLSCSAACRSTGGGVSCSGLNEVAAGAPTDEDAPCEDAPLGCRQHTQSTHATPGDGQTTGAASDVDDGGGGICGGGGGKGPGSRIPSGRVCAKCRVNSAELVANQREPYCGACLRHSLMYRFKTAVNKHALVQAQDVVLLAFSGGHASTVLLHFLSEIQSHATTAQAAAADRGRTVFRLGLVFVSPAAVLPRPDYDGGLEINQIRRLVAPFVERGCRLHVVGLEDLFGEEGAQQGSEDRKVHPSQESLGASGSGTDEGRGNIGRTEDAEFEQGVGVPVLNGARERLKAMVAGVTDATAQEDLVELLQTELVQKVAVEHGYTKVAVGTCASRLAARVLTGTIKGRGFSLPADLQPVDRRRAVPVVAPLCDCVLKELAILCTLNRWPTTFVPSLDAGPTARPSLDRLTQDFLTIIEDDLPGRTHTILRTAGKLQPFPFNAFPALPPGHRARLQPAQSTDSVGPRDDTMALCALCRAPLSRAEQSVKAEGQEAAGSEGKSEPEADGRKGEGAAAMEERLRLPANRLKEAGSLQAGCLSDIDALEGVRGIGVRRPERTPASHEFLNEVPAKSVASNTVCLGNGNDVEERTHLRDPLCCRSCKEQVLGEGGSGSGFHEEWLCSVPWVYRERTAMRDSPRRAHMRNELRDFLL